jgi:hypothetical protein
VARWIQHRHRPWWHVWYGRATRQYWAMPAWAPGPYGLLAATTPEALDPDYGSARPSRCDREFEEFHFI